MRLQDLVKIYAAKCRERVKTCQDVGDPIFDDMFEDVLTEFATNVIEDEDVPKPPYE
jgi:hypothetical protein